jgi:hypothetical protein
MLAGMRAQWAGSLPQLQLQHLYYKQRKPQGHFFLFSKVTYYQGVLVNLSSISFSC